MKLKLLIRAALFAVSIGTAYAADVERPATQAHQIVAQDQVPAKTQRIVASINASAWNENPGAEG
jgi:hypothetical protein